MTAWNGFLHKKVHLIACGGTAMTLLGIKESTRDVDFMVPVEGEYRYLIKILKQLGYVPSSGSGWKRPSEGYIYDLSWEIGPTPPSYLTLRWMKGDIHFVYWGAQSL